MPHLHTEPGGVDLCVEVFCVYGRRVLLRRHEKYGIWLGCGGHVEEWEDPAEAAVREVKEEAGLELLLPEPEAVPGVPAAAGHRLVALPRFIDRHPITPEHAHCAFVYFGQTTTDVVLPAAGEAATELRWLTIDQLLDPALDVMDSIRFYALTALDELAYSGR